jgi:hypothetical protein
MITSNWIPDATMVKIRIAEAVFVTGFYLYRVVINPVEFYYLYTNFNWTINLIYFWIAGAITFKSWKKNVPVGRKWLQIFMSIVLPTSILVTTVFWIFMSSEVISPTKKIESRIRSALSHLLNTVIPLLDLILSNILLPSYLVISSILFYVLYANIVLLLRFLTWRTWPYRFLDTVDDDQYGLSPRMIGIGIASVVGLAIAFVVTKGIINLRDKYLKSGDESVEVQV